MWARRVWKGRLSTGELDVREFLGGEELEVRRSCLGVMCQLGVCVDLNIHCLAVRTDHVPRHK